MLPASLAAATSTKVKTHRESQASFLSNTWATGGSCSLHQVVKGCVWLGLLLLLLLSQQLLLLRLLRCCKALLRPRLVQLWQIHLLLRIVRAQCRQRQQWWLLWAPCEPNINPLYLQSFLVANPLLHTSKDLVASCHRQTQNMAAHSTAYQLLMGTDSSAPHCLMQHRLLNQQCSTGMPTLGEMSSAVCAQPWCCKLEEYQEAERRPSHLDLH